MPKYQHKPTVIEAEQFLWPAGKAPLKADKFLGIPVKWDASKKVAYLEVDTNHGPARAEVGDFVVTTSSGEKYPVKAVVFHENYEIPGVVKEVAQKPPPSY